MNAPFFNDTIAAVATAPGRAAVALLRVSGSAAGEILLSVCPSLGSTLPTARLQRLLPLVHPTSGELLDRSLVSWFPGPFSYTGEDTLEVSCHGGALVPSLVLDALLAAGARPAGPGEFTHRAVLNGKLDLLQAEAVLDLIDGRSRALHRAAINQMDRGLSYRIDRLRAAILQVEALLVYGIDFPEEDEPPVSPERILDSARSIVHSIDTLLSTAHLGSLLREGALVVLAGAPNSGKSSLFNALLGLERSIVTDVPGTTRDAVEAVAEIDGYPFRLIDTAGLRRTDDRVEEIGIEVARRYLAAADVILFCVPAGRPLQEAEADFLHDIDSERILTVQTMSDLRQRSDSADELLSVSALTGSGLSDLARALLQKAFGGLVSAEPQDPLITRQRHARQLQLARTEVLLFIAAADQVPLEFAATHLRSAAEALEDLVGALTPDDVLGQVFGLFCVGK
ncbi:tRNA uridine-5-carboxymethylaminomethyl(34) synthesis GTPase MnmE [soil metagenome]